MSDKYTELIDKINNSKGTEARNRMKLFSFSYNIFFGNLYELEKTLKAAEEPNYALILKASGNMNATSKAFIEIYRLFHNFLAAAMTLVDHSRNFIKYYDDTLLQKELSRKIASEFAKNEIHCFIKDLRNFMLHNKLPFGEMVFPINLDVMNKRKSTFFLRPKELLTWKNWSPTSKDFLNAQGETINLSKIVTPYGQKILQHHKWLEQQFYHHHFTELNELDQLLVLQQKLELDSKNKGLGK